MKALFAIACLLMISAASSWNIYAEVSYCQYASWKQNVEYTGGSFVTYQGHHYSSKYSGNVGNVPNVSPVEWIDLGSCNVVSNGFISPSGNNFVANGGSITFTFGANEGYTIREIVKDCCNNLPVTTTSYTFTNVVEDHCIYIYI